ncbi:MAG: hypothetical protein RR501_10210 [Cloacibacillus sp.]
MKKSTLFTLIASLLFFIATEARADAARLLSMELLGGVIQNVSTDCYSYVPNHNIPLSEAVIYKVNQAVRERVGFVADGNTRLVLRIKSSAPGTVRLSPESSLPAGVVLENTDRSAAGETLSLPLQEAAPGIYQASAVITAPEAWPGSASQEYFSFTVKASLDDEALSKEIRIYRAPVVLIHGIWSDGETFGDVVAPGTLAGELYAAWKKESMEGRRAQVGYFEYPGDKGPSEVLPVSSDVFYRSIENMIRDLRMKKIEATRVDLVGHSLGGLMIRKFCINRYYRNNQNYNQGAVRRIVMLATPNTGAGIASFVTADTEWLSNKTLDSSPDYKEKMTKVYDLLGELGLNVRGSAIKDLAINSPELRLLNDNLPAGLPLYRIAGNTGRELIAPGAISKAMKAIIEPYTHESIFSKIPELFSSFASGKTNYISEDSDCLVGLSSALWSGVMEEDKACEVMQDVQHMWMGEKEVIASRVSQLLGSELSLFEPIPEKSSLVFPASASPFSSKAVLSLRAASLAEDPAFENKLKALEKALKDERGNTAAKPEKNKLTALWSYPEAPLLISAGTVRRIVINGNYSNGTMKNISHKDDGTSYSIEDGTIAQVTEDGMLTALAPGKTVLKAVNKELSTELKIYVIPFAVIPYDEKVDPEDPPVDPADEISVDVEPIAAPSSSGGCSAGFASACAFFAVACVICGRRRK